VVAVSFAIVGVGFLGDATGVPVGLQPQTAAIERENVCRGDLEHAVDESARRVLEQVPRLEERSCVRKVEP